MNELVSTEWLSDHLSDPELVVADIRWTAADPDGGNKAYLEGHIPGAIVLSLDRVLSDRSDLSRGRHPLPNPELFVKMLAEIGIGKGNRIVAYDDAAGSIAARFWWMMTWIGADCASVLDGGITKWIAELRSLEQGKSNRVQRAVQPYTVKLNPAMVAKMSELESGDSNLLLIDARAPERYRGEIEPIDMRGGHIPGAINYPFSKNLTDTEPQVFRSQEELAKLFRDAGVDKSRNIVSYCGSGVTACHNLLAMQIAGIDNARLYPGSWSEWACHHDA
jgi:thiosulfate/3-mercaptopyruvate sulfurtransferase